MAYTEQQRVYKRQHYLKNRERLIEASSVHYHKNSEKLCAERKRYSSEHPLTPEQKEKQKVCSAEHYKNNRTQVLIRSKKYNATHPEIRKKAMAKYLENNREKLRKRSREFYHKNREGEIQRAIRRNHVRRAQKMASQIDPKFISEWMSEVRSKPFGRCYWCGTKVPGPEIQFDHITPLIKGGSHTIGNLCVSCAPCNQHKSARAISDWICQGQTFLPL